MQPILADPLTDETLLPQVSETPGPQLQRNRGMEQHGACSEVRLQCKRAFSHQELFAALYQRLGWKTRS